MSEDPSQNLAHRFVLFLSKMFELEGFKVERDAVTRGIHADLLITNRVGDRAVVEAKLYRAKYANISLLNPAAVQAERIRQSLDAVAAILATPSIINHREWMALSKNNRLLLFDYKSIELIASKYPDLLTEFESITRQSYVEQRVEREPDDENERVDSDISDKISAAARSESFSHPNPASPPHAGKDICKRLYATEPGLKGAGEFELRCEDAIKYIFEPSFSNWSRQKRSDNGLNRYDLIAKITSSDDLWALLAEDFRSRYVIFEAKNYSNPIGQDEITLTEKYLFRTALRSICVIVTRNGANKNAHLAARGALRTDGKLILIVSLKQLCEMLHAKDHGDDPLLIFGTFVDEIMMKIER